MFFRTRILVAIVVIAVHLGFLRYFVLNFSFKARAPCLSAFQINVQSSSEHSLNSSSFSSSSSFNLSQPPLTLPSHSAKKFIIRDTEKSHKKSTIRYTTKANHQSTVRELIQSPAKTISSTRAGISQASRYDASSNLQIEYLGPKPVAVYPYQAKRLGETGQVIVQVQINSQGHVQHTRLATSSGFWRLDEAALKAASQAHFKPLIKNGLPISVQVRLPFKFILEN